MFIPKPSTDGGMRKGVIILCGGKSSRMGRDKATLPFGPELMLQRIVRLVSHAVPMNNIAVVAAPDQSLSPLPGDLLVARDAEAFRGPLQGLATGLHAVGDRFDAIYLTGCDVPLLVPAMVDWMFHQLGTFDIAVPVDRERHYPLAAVYRPRVLPHIQTLLKAGRLRPVFLFDKVRTREIPVDELRVADPQLSTLTNVNQWEDYLSTLNAAGLSLPDDVRSNQSPAN
ncbi:MAG TPA: molybdenum cofactor guanylyltransferase [Lacipirellulaceae bacterium]|nr:molybdenum cofactor guanylyltransferase [Lacipirellulaceae bacterium]